jgi:peptide/nickel transport system substrate-binding protein
MNRLSRRQFLARTSQAAGLLALQACTPTAGVPQASPSAPPLKGLAAQGILRWDTATEATSVHPLRTSLPAVRRITVWTHNSLFRPTNTPGENIPDLAAALPTVLKDGLEYEIKLRPGVVWHDGTPFTAADVVATMNATKDQANNFIWRARLDRIAGVERVDDLTVRVSLTKPDNRFKDRLGFVPIVKANEVLNTDLLSTKPTGTGPFKYVEVRSGDRIILEPHTNYFRTGLPKVKGIQYVTAGDASARIVNLVNGETALTSDVPYPEVDTLKGRGVTVISTQAPSRFYMDINIRRAEFQDVNFRRALTYAIDRQAIVDTVFKGQAAIGQGSYPPTNQYNDASLKPYGPRPDLDKARSFLSQAQVVPKRRITIEWAAGPSEPQNAATILQANFKAIGIDLELKPVDVATSTANLRGGNYDLGLLVDFSGQTLAYTPFTLAISWQTGSSGNFWAYSDPETDRQVDIILGSQDEKAVADALHWLQAKDIELAHRVAICYPRFLEAQGVPLKDYVPSGLGNLPYGVEQVTIG